MTDVFARYITLEQRDKAERELAEARRDVRRLWAALFRHGVHDVTCAKRRSLFACHEIRPCDCGFDDALAISQEAR